MAGQIAERGRGCVGEGRPLSHSPALAARCATLLRSSYSIASSARLSNDWGKAMPSAFGLEVDYEIVLDRRLHWQVGRLLAPKNAIDAPCCLRPLVDLIDSITQ